MRYMLIRPLYQDFFFFISFLSIHVNADLLKSDQVILHHKAPVMLWNHWFVVSQFISIQIDKEISINESKS